MLKWGTQNDLLIGNNVVHLEFCTNAFKPKHKVCCQFVCSAYTYHLERGTEKYEYLV